MTEPELEIDWATLMQLVNLSATRTVFLQVSDLLDTVHLEDEEIDALLKMPAQYRQTVTAQLLSHAESLREATRDLDGQLLRLTEV